MCAQHRAHVRTQWSQVSVLPRTTSLGQGGEQGIVGRRNANRKEREKEGGGGEVVRGRKGEGKCDLFLKL